MSNQDLTVILCVLGLQFTVCTHVAFFQGLTYVNTYKHKPRWSGESVAGFILLPIIFNIVINGFYANNLVMVVGINFVVWLGVIGTIIFKGVPSEDPEFFEGALYGFAGGIFIWLGFLIGYNIPVFDIEANQRQVPIAPPNHIGSQKIQTNSIAIEIGNLKNLRDNGALSQDEFDQAKQKVLGKAA
jgi:hypothetical protein